MATARPAVGPSSSSSSAAASREKFLSKRKFRNNLPEIPYDAKCLELPFNAKRFIDYQTTTLERQFKPQLYTELDLGVKIDLIHPGVYQPRGVPLAPEDAELLRSEATEEKKRDPYRPSVPWMMKTTYISNDLETRKVENPGFETVHAHNLEVEEEYAFCASGGWWWCSAAAVGCIIRWRFVGDCPRNSGCC